MKMKFQELSLSILLLLLPLMAFSQVDFIEIVTAEDMEAAKKKADEGMLLLFVDVYATWCGPCKMMDSEVYTDSAVAEYMNQHFVNVRMDGETDFGRKYAAEQKLQGYPSMFIFGDEGDKISTVFGFKPAADLVPLLSDLVENYKALKVYKAQAKNGSITLEAYADYIDLVRALGNVEKAEGLAGEYIRLKLGDELKDSDIRVVAHYMDLEDAWWSVFATETERVKKVLGKDYLPVLETIHNNTLLKAVEGKNIELVSRMANELAPLMERESDGSGDLKSLPFIQYYYYTSQHEELVGYIDSRFAADRKDDHRWLFGAASKVVDMDQQAMTPELLVKGEEWFQTCIELDEQYDYFFYYGMVLFFEKKTGEALVAFEKAESLAETEEQLAMIKQVLTYIRR